MPFPDTYYQQLSEALARPIAPDKRWLVIPLCESLFPYGVHWEYTQGGTLAFHIEPGNPSPPAKGLADFLLRSGIGRRSNIRYRYFEYSWDRIRPQEGNAREVADAIKAKERVFLPLVMKYLDEIASHHEGEESFVERIHAFYDKRLETEKRSTFNLNIIDELHANENAHTRILIRLLQYRTGNVFPFLESFLNMLPGWGASSLAVGNPQIDFNVNFIDGLILSPEQYAVIIENKIHWAADQKAQLNRYYRDVRNRGIPEKNIWIVYLTLDGRKLVSDDSLSHELRASLKEHYVALNYRNHILPWLKEGILPNCAFRETALISGVQQYIDHLEGIFGIRESEKKMQQELEAFLKRISGISPDRNGRALYEELSDLEHQVTTYAQMVSNMRAAQEKSVLTSFLDLSRECLHQLYPDQLITCTDLLYDNYIQILSKKWRDDVHFEWVPFSPSCLFRSVESMSLVLHVEGATEPVRRMRDELQKKGYSASAQSTWYRVALPVTQKAFCDMNLAERKAFLKETYESIRPVIVDLNDIFAEN